MNVYAGIAVFVGGATIACGIYVIGAVLHSLLTRGKPSWLKDAEPGEHLELEDDE